MARLLRTDLPDEVWDRLDAEARSHGMKIGAYLRQLVINRDTKREQRRNDGAQRGVQPSPDRTDTGRDAG